MSELLPACNRCGVSHMLSSLDLVEAAVLCTSINTCHCWCHQGRYVITAASTIQSQSCVCADLFSVLPQQCCTAALSSGCARSICAADTLVCQESMPSATFSVLARRSAAGNSEGITEWAVVHGPSSQLAAAACR